MRVRPIYHAKLGKMFEHARVQHRWSQEHAAKRAGTPVTRQKLLRLELGQVEHPDHRVLEALCRVYGIPYEEVVVPLVNAQFGLRITSSALRHALADLESPRTGETNKGGGGDAGSEARPLGGVSDARFENVAVHAEALLRLADRIEGFGELGNELRRIAVSLAAGHFDVARPASARRTSHARQARARSRRARSSGTK